MTGCKTCKWMVSIIHNKETGTATVRCRTPGIAGICTYQMTEDEIRVPCEDHEEV